MDKRLQTIATYDQTAVEMAKKFDAMKPRTEDVGRFFNLIENIENPTVVEIGCGTGRDAAEIFQYTDNYTGIDVSKGLLEIAREALPKANFELADVENYQFQKGLDGAVAFASLLHSKWESIKKVFAEVGEKLVDGGIFYISLKRGEYNPEGDTREDQFGIRTYFFYTPEDLEELAGKRFERIYLDEQHLNGQDWFTIVFRKVN